MNSLWYGLAMIAIIVVVHWMITNDGRADDETTGVLAMKSATKDGLGGKRAKRKKFSLEDVR
ncbi:MAG TPA: hypothetical protein VL026_07140 [Rhizomicrobium sp.]|nr:hypothetical protein [Rhizomicrobium sp.]